MDDLGYYFLIRMADRIEGMNNSPDCIQVRCYVAISTGRERGIPASQ